MNLVRKTVTSTAWSAGNGDRPIPNESKRGKGKPGTLTEKAVGRTEFDGHPSQLHVETDVAHQADARTDSGKHGASVAHVAIDKGVHTPATLGKRALSVDRRRKDSKQAHQRNHAEANRSGHQNLQEQNAKDDAVGQHRQQA